VWKKHRDRIDLRALALVDRQRVDGVDGVEPGRADLKEAALALEDRALAAAVAGNDHARVPLLTMEASGFDYTALQRAF
jgi:hypothetical protein